VRRADPLYSGVLLISACFRCSVLSGKSLCDGLIPCTEQSCGCLSLLSVFCFDVVVCATG